MVLYHLSKPWVTPRLEHSTLHSCIETHRADSPQTVVYMNLQPPDDTARLSPTDWWSLTPPSHPYSLTYSKEFEQYRWAVIFFCRHLLSPIASIFRSGVPYAARTFLSYLLIPAAGPEHCFPWCKVKLNSLTQQQFTQKTIYKNRRQYHSHDRCPHILSSTWAVFYMTRPSCIFNF